MTQRTLNMRVNDLLRAWHAYSDTKKRASRTRSAKSRAKLDAELAQHTAAMRRAAKSLWRAGYVVADGRPIHVRI